MEDKTKRIIKSIKNFDKKFEYGEQDWSDAETLLDELKKYFNIK